MDRGDGGGSGGRGSGSRGGGRGGDGGGLFSLLLLLLSLLRQRAFSTYPARTRACAAREAGSTHLARTFVQRALVLFRFADARGVTPER